MAEGIVYLDVDDEITSAAQRIRSAPGTKVALVVPYGSRIATSRMNFRLLSREALVSNRRLSIVSGDAAARSLAASAGLPVYGTVPEYEAALARPADDRGSASSGSSDAAVGDQTATGAAPAAGLIASETIAAVGPVVGSAGASADTPPSPAESTTPDGSPASVGGRKSQRPKRPVPAETPSTLWAPAGSSLDSAEDGAGSDEPSVDRPPGRSRVPLFAALGIVALAVVVLAVGGYLFLPTASVALTARRDPIGPIELTVSADPSATAVDATNNIVPAVRLDVPVQATRTFTTVGVKVKETPAGGSVTFTNYDPTSSNTIPSGSIVSTEGGIRFRTLATLVVPRAAFTPPSTTVPSEASVQVQAVVPGKEGNVPANAIRVVPPGESPLFLAVTNPNETIGGTHTETPQVKQAEVDKALADLQRDLDTAFRQAIASGAGAPPDTTLFPATATLGPATPTPDPKTLVGQAVDTFDLTLSASGTVIAVDPRPVRTIAEQALTAQVDSKHRLVDGSISIDVGEGGVGEDGQVTFQATARALAVTIVDANAIRALVKGKTAADARTALAPFGSATVTLWPDWVTTVTGLDARLTVTVDDGPPGTPSTGPSAGPSPSPRPTGAPLSSPSARAPGRSGSAAP